MTPPMRRILPPLVLALAVVAAYAGSFVAGFVLDDARTVESNAQVRRPGAFVREGRVLHRRGLVDLTFALNYATGGLNPADYHATNVAMHVAAVLLLFGLTRRVLRRPGLPGWCGRRAAEAAFWSSLLWGVHPVTTAAVTYVSQRYESLMAVFYLLMFYALLRAADSGRPRRWLTLCAAACLLGLLCKEVIVTAPVLLLCFDRIYVSRSWRELWRARGWVYGAMAVVWPLVALPGGGAAVRAGPLVAPTSPLRYALTQLGVIAHYLELLVRPGGLCLDYGWPPAAGLRDVLPGGLVTVVAGLATLAGLAWRPRAAFPALAFFVILSPTSSFAPRPDAAFDHRLYLPAAPVVVLVVLGGLRAVEMLAAVVAARGWARERAIRLGAAAAACSAALWLGLGTAERNADYASALSMARDVVAKRPANFRGHLALISALVEGGRLDEAEQAARRLLTRTRRAVREGGAHEPTPALQPVRHAAAAHNQLGRVLLMRGRVAGAAAEFRAALALRPAYKVAMHNLALSLYASGETADAMAWLRRALAVDAGYAAAHALLGFILAEQGEYGEALRHYRAARAADPSDAAALAELAWLLAVAPDAHVRDGAEARALAAEALAGTAGASAVAWDVLGAACAELGRFDEAKAAAARAVELLGEGGDRIEANGESVARPVLPGVRTARGSYRASLRARAALYAEGRPYRLERATEQEGSPQGLPSITDRMPVRP